MDIAVITGRQVRRRVEAALERLRPPCRIVMAEYDSFSHIPQVYDQYAGEADGFLVSGQAALEAIRRTEHVVSRPVLSFQSGPAEIYRAVLLFLLDHPEGDAGRIVLDFLLPLGEEYTAEAFIRRKQLDALGEKTGLWLRSLSWEELLDVEASIARRLIGLWERQEMDMVISLYSSIIPILEDCGVPCKYPVLSDADLNEPVRELLAKIELNRLRSSLPAAVSAAPRYKKQATPENMRLLAGAMDDFLREHMLDCVIQEDAGCYNLLTTAEVLHRLTDRCETSRITCYLEERLSVPTAIGYGVGGSPSRALLNACAARKESEISGKAFIRNEQGDLIGPLGTHLRMVVEQQSVQDAEELARRCGLAALTIRKVAASAKLAGSNRLTTQELAKRLGVSVRNANRILGSMTEGGAARVVCSQTPQSRGRPVKVYELTFDT